MRPPVQRTCKPCGLPSYRFSALHRGGSGTPLVCLHGFTDTWRTWELVLPTLERHHDVLAPTLLGHAGGPPAGDGADDELSVDAIERAMDDAGFATAHVVGNSLGGYLAFKLAERGRARSVVALAPAGGWAPADESRSETLRYFATLREMVGAALPYAENIMSSAEGRRRATYMITTNFEHIPSELLVHQTYGVANCSAAEQMIEHALHAEWTVDAERVSCPVRIVWGTADRVLAWPSSAKRFQDDWFPNADWIELEGVGHCPQLDVPLETAELIVGFTAERRVPGTVEAR